MALTTGSVKKEEPKRDWEVRLDAEGKGYLWAPKKEAPVESAKPVVKVEAPKEAKKPQFEGELKPFPTAKWTEGKIKQWLLDHKIDIAYDIDKEAKGDVLAKIKKFREELGV